MSKVIKSSDLKDGVSVTVTVSKTPSVKDYVPARFELDQAGPEQVVDFRSHIASTIEQWRKNARDHVSDVEEQVQQRLAEAYRKGMQDGMQKARADQEAAFDVQFNSRLRAVDSLLAEARQTQQNWAPRLEQKVIVLSLAIAESIIKKQIEADPSLVEGIVREALGYVVNSEKLVLKVSPADYETINSRRDDWFLNAGNAKEFRIEMDSRLGPGNCLVETDGGVIDATIRSRLDVIAENLARIAKK